MHPPTQPPLSQDAALVATLAGTAMAFSNSAQDQAERWLRTFRLHGQVGTAMQALGIGEAPLMTGSEPVSEACAEPALGDEAVERVVVRAREIATRREAECTCTVDLLFALFDIYGELIDSALYVRGSSRKELLERLPGGQAVGAGC